MIISYFLTEHMLYGYRNYAVYSKLCSDSSPVSGINYTKQNDFYWTISVAKHSVQANKNPHDPCLHTERTCD